jgi:hypothetical protein
MRCDRRYPLSFVGQEPHIKARCQMRMNHPGNCLVIEPLTGQVLEIDVVGIAHRMTAHKDEAMIQRAQEAVPRG